MHAIGADRPRAKESMIFATQSTHKLLAGICRRRRRCSCRTRENGKLDRHRFNEAYLMHTSTSRSTRSSRRATSPRR